MPVKEKKARYGKDGYDQIESFFHGIYLAWLEFVKVFIIIITLNPGQANKIFEARFLYLKIRQISGSINIYLLVGGDDSGGGNTPYSIFYESWLRLQDWS